MGSLVCGLATSSVVAPHLAPSSHPALWALVVVRPFSLHRLRSPLSDPVLFSSDRQLLPPTVIGHHLFGVVRIHQLPDPVACAGGHRIRPPCRKIRSAHGSPAASAVRQVAPSPSSTSASWARAHMSSQGPRESSVAATSTALPCTGRTCHLNYRTLHGCHRPGLPSACLRVYDGWR
jgi:hypothetical protein